MDQKQQIAERLKSANNILVTVSNNPSVDQLASCIGLTLSLNKMGKHATAVFSGTVPSTIEFLQPEKTIETNTDSLRDFIISLDKAKADKLRYKVEDKVVKIFITPYRTSISDKDLEFSQGDFNVDVVIALGVHNQADLDQAITSHGRILHDAAIATINVKPGGELGSLNWLAPSSSSLSELVAELINVTGKEVMDGQIATALLTGIVAETGRFGNEKTSPATMSISSALMAAGANQQLVATKLDEFSTPSPSKPAAPVADLSKETGDTPLELPKHEDGTLEISHESEPKPKKSAEPEPKAEPEKPKEETDETNQIHIDSQGELHNIREEGEESKAEGTIDPTQHMGSSRMILQPPTMGGPLSASAAGDNATSSDPLSLPSPTEPPSGAPAPSLSPFAPPASAATATPSIPYLSPNVAPGAATPLVTPEPSPVPTVDSVASPVSPLNPITPPEPTVPPMPPLAAPVSEPVTPFIPPASAPEPPDLVPSTLPPEPFTTPIEPPQDDSHITNARDAVMQAIASQPAAVHNPEPIQALNAHPFGEPLHSPSEPSIIKPSDFSVPSGPSDLAPPPGPPPMMPPPQQ